tara:strand:+ start:184 stop:1272 length:1089 start_codon:yes stop_codon:yes gene_type:complete
MSYFILINYIYFKFLSYQNKKKQNVFTLIFCSYLIFVFVSLRYQIGGDWGTYMENYENMSRYGLVDGLSIFASKFVFFIVYLFHDFKIFNETVVLGCIFCFFYTRYLLSTSNFFLSFFITFPVFLILVGMGYVHQGVATIICWQILINFEKKTSKEIIIYIAFASLIHLSALIFLYIFLIKLKIKKQEDNFLFHQIIAIFILCIIAMLIFDINVFKGIALNLQVKFETYLFDDYYKSYGTLMRLFLFIPSIIILLIIDLKHLKNKDNLKLLKNTLYVMFATILLTIIFRGSILFAFADRIFLGLIFFQVIITNEYYKQYKLKKSLFIDFLVYFFPVSYLLLWLTTSKYSQYWIPYENILFTY